MKGFFVAILGAVALATAFAADYCGQWDNQNTGRYIVYNNLWNMKNATSGSQCTGVDSISTSGDTIAWHSSFSWAGKPAEVKSYANAARVFTPVPLTSVSSIPSTVKYSYTASGSPIMDISYDLFTSSTSGGKNEYEIMIWLAALNGAGPISSTGKAIATVTIGGVSFKLYKGPNGSTTVYSFVASKTTTSFSADLKLFFSYLAANQGFPTSQYLNVVEFGTEPFVVSNVKLTVSSYSAKVVTA
jgi:xyloglucan-specific endo-beta-1,4-glucanase